MFKSIREMLGFHSCIKPLDTTPLDEPKIPASPESTKPAHDPFGKNEGVLPTKTVEGPILGYRWWKIKLHEGKYVLQSLHKDTLWTERTLQCENGHGIYCYKTLDLSIVGWPVYGEIEIYGQVVVHENGYRAERALVKKLWLWEASWPKMLAPELRIFDTEHHFKVKEFEKAAQDLEERYECSVETEPGRVYDQIMTAHRWKKQHEEEQWKSEESLKSSKSSPLVSPFQTQAASAILTRSQQNMTQSQQRLMNQVAFGSPFLSQPDFYVIYST